MQTRSIEIKTMQRRITSSLRDLLARCEGLQISANPRFYPPKAEVVSSNLAGCVINFNRLVLCFAGGTENSPPNPHNEPSAVGFRHFGGSAREVDDLGQR
jgi:hypothetical protein